MRATAQREINRSALTGIVERFNLCRLALTFLRFCATGGLLTFLSGAVFLGFSNMGLHYALSTIISWIVTFPLGFFINKIFVFQNKQNYSLIEILRYLANAILQLAFSLLCYYITIAKFSLELYLSVIIATSASAAFSFTVSRLFVFPSVPSRDPNA